MNLSVAFMRILFVVLSVFFMTTFMISNNSGSIQTNILIGVLIGFTFGLFLISLDLLFKRFNLRSFNIAVIGIFLGYLMGQALVLIFDAILNISQVSISLQPQTLEMLKIALFLFGTYLGTIMTLRAADELYVSIPFIKFVPTVEKKKDLIIDSSVLSDARIIDLATTGLLDNQIIIPRFIIKELYTQAEISDEFFKLKAKKCLEVLKKIELISELGLRFNDTDFPDVKDVQGKLLRLARLLDANLLTADISQMQIAKIEDIRIINIHTLSNSLKPLMQAGEFIKIKVQRYGKEPRQGVGYLDDGTMVVINGGGNYIGVIVDAKVLSVKHTTSGRMVFCNAVDDKSGQEHEHEENHE